MRLIAYLKVLTFVNVKKPISVTDQKLTFFKGSRLLLQSSDILALTSTVPRFIDILVALDLLFSSDPGVNIYYRGSLVSKTGDLELEGLVGNTSW